MGDKVVNKHGTNLSSLQYFLINMLHEFKDLLSEACK